MLGMDTQLPQGTLERPPQEGAMASGQWLVVAGLFILAILVMALPVAWNGFVFVYPDSIDYLGLTFDWQMPEFRTAAYGLFAGVGHLAGDPVAIVLAQSALVVGIIALSVRAQFAPPQFIQAFALTLLAALAGGISLFASQIMADVFAGATILGLASLMVFGDGLRPGLRLLLSLLCAIAIAVHTSHVALAIGLLALAFAARFVRHFWLALPLVRLREAVLATALGIVLAVAGNYYVTGRVFLTQTASLQDLALFVEGGSAKAYLDAHCPPVGSDKMRRAPFKLCSYRDHLPATANEFLWAKWASPLYKLGGWNAMRREADAIVDGTIETMPGLVLRQSAVLTARQFFMLDPGDGLDQRFSYYVTAIGRWYPKDMKAFANSRQQHGIDFRPLYWPTRLIMGLSLAAILILALAGRHAPRQALFGGAILLAVLGNAFICGALSNPNHRYQGRLVWLAASAAAVMMMAEAASGRVRVRREATAAAGG